MISYNCAKFHAFMTILNYISLNSSTKLYVLQDGMLRKVILKASSQRVSSLSLLLKYVLSCSKVNNITSQGDLCLLNWKRNII